jgi:acetyltransferase-like isoleucine patch superfamily enzyme
VTGALRAVVRWLLVRSALVRARLRYWLGGITAVAAMGPKAAKAQLIPLLRRYGASVGDACDLCDGLRLHNVKEDFRNLVIGDRVHLGPETLLDLTGPIRIGDGATIAMRCTLLTHTDAGASAVARQGFPLTVQGLVIGPGAYLGAGCLVLMGSSIGREAVIGAGSLVRGEIAERVVAVGRPARRARPINPPCPLSGTGAGPEPPELNDRSTA